MSTSRVEPNIRGPEIFDLPWYQLNAAEKNRIRSREYIEIETARGSGKPIPAFLIKY